MTDGPVMDARETKGSKAGLWVGPLLVLGGGVSIGFAPIGLRLGLDTMGPQAIAFWRYLFATPMVFTAIFLVYRRFPVRPNRFAVIAGVFFALDIGLWHAALTLTSVANSAFIVNLGNIGVGLLAWIFLKERLNWIWLLAVIVAFVGAGLLTQGGGENGVGDFRGDLLALGAAVFVSFYVLCSKIARREMSGLDVLFWVTFVEMVTAGLITLASGERFMPMDAEGWRAPLLLAVIVQCVGQGLIITGLGRTPAAIAGVLILVQPVVAAALSWQMFGEHLLGWQIVGGALILVGVFISQLGKAPAKPV